jgi:hypothetical protein
VGVVFVERLVEVGEQSLDGLRVGSMRIGFSAESRQRYQTEQTERQRRTGSPWKFSRFHGFLWNKVNVIDACSSHARTDVIMGKTGHRI